MASHSDYDVIVVGAGPVGSLLADTIAREGHSVVVLEEHSVVGKPEHCSGKISVKALETLGLKPVGALQSVRKAVFYSPDMNPLVVKRSSVQAYILDRAHFDEYLARRATKNGAVLLTNSRVREVFITPERLDVVYDLKGEQKRMSSRVLVGADGVKSTIAKRVGIYSKKNQEVRVAFQQELADVQDLDPETVELYFGNKYAPGFFAWIIPVGKNIARVGLCVSPKSGKSAMACLNEFIKTHPIASEKMKHSSFVSESVHVIPTGGPIKETTHDGVVIVGDAAGQVKSTTGGGLYYGMLCAKMAGNVIARMLTRNPGDGILKRSLLDDYQTLWKKALGKEIKIGTRIRSFIDLLTDEELNYLFRLLRENRSLIDLIEAEGDVDWQSGIASLLLKHLAKPFMMKPSLIYKLSRSFYL